MSLGRWAIKLEMNVHPSVTRRLLVRDGYGYKEQDRTEERGPVM